MIDTDFKCQEVVNSLSPLKVADKKRNECILQVGPTSHKKGNSVHAIIEKQTGLDPKGVGPDHLDERLFYEGGSMLERDGKTGKRRRRKQGLVEVQKGGSLDTGKSLAGKKHVIELDYMESQKKICVMGSQQLFEQTVEAAGQPRREQ